MESIAANLMVLSWPVFGIWWITLLGIHLVTCGYNLAFALVYWALPGTRIGLDMEFYRIGMSTKYYSTIAAVHIVMSSLHGASIALMVGSSLWHRQLVFTPWGESTIVLDVMSRTKIAVGGRPRSSRINSMILTKAFTFVAWITDRNGLFGTNGKYFHVLQASREIIETGFQTVQAYRMSRLLPSILLNRFYVLALVLNCFTSAVVYALPFRHHEGQKRFAVLVCDLALDLMACMGVVLIVVGKYVGQYDPETSTFGTNPLYNDEWAARALNEFQLVAVASYSDLLGRAVFSLGLLVTTTNLKELLYHKPKHRNCVATSPQISDKPVKVSDSGLEVFEVKKSFVQPPIAATSNSSVKVSIRRRISRASMLGVQLFFFMWGVAVLVLHIHGSLQPALPQCTLQVYPWGASKPSCFLVCLDCYQIGITGQIDDVDSNWREFDGSTVIMILIKHCPALDIPNAFNDFHQLFSLKIYNTTIAEWRASAAFTNSNHPNLVAVLMVRVNMTDGLLPEGFLSKDFPQNLVDIEFCSTNLRELPDDLGFVWIPGSSVLIEYSQLNAFPAVLLQLITYMFSVSGNPINEIPPELFEIEGLIQIGIGDTNIKELPRDVTQLASTITKIFIPTTDVSYFWDWMDQLLERTSMVDGGPLVYAGGSVYCSELEMIVNGSIGNFSANFTPQFSPLLMDPTKAADTRLAVDCSPSTSGFSGPLYPLAAEDSRNALGF